MSLRLSVFEISKSYNGNHVLLNCSFSFDSSGIYALMGQNGCGKSTFLRICAMLEEPDSGSIIYFSNGEIVTKDIALKRRVTLVLPKVGVFNTTVFRNVAYGLKIRGMKRSQIEEKVERALEFVDLKHKRNQNALTLSSGEAQRLGIARALAIEPEILLLDEPTASVDVKNTEIIERIILDLKADDRKTVVITTHDIEQAKRLTDYTLVLKDGRVSSSIL